MNLEEAIRIAMNELGVCDEEIESRIAVANQYASPVGQIQEIKPGAERDAIDAFKALYSSTQSPEGQLALHRALQKLRDKRMEN
jgi:hypothetical protein